MAKTATLFAIKSKCCNDLIALSPKDGGITAPFVHLWREDAILHMQTNKLDGIVVETTVKELRKHYDHFYLFDCTGGNVEPQLYATNRKQQAR